MAAGLDPGRCILFRQSDVKEHTELCWLLSSVTAYGDLQRMTPVQGEVRARAGAGAHRACSSTRCSRRPTSCSTAPTRCPWATTSASTSSSRARSPGASTPPTARCWWSPPTGSRRSGARIMDLQEPGLEDVHHLRQRRRPRVHRRRAGRHPAQAQARPDRLRAARWCAPPDKPGISNLIEILAVTRGVAPEEVEREFAGQGYGAFKEAVGEAVVELLAPVRERYLELRADEAALEAALAGGRRARPLDRHRRDGRRPRRDGRRTAGLT